MKVIKQAGINPIVNYRGSRFPYNGRDYIVREVSYGSCVVEEMRWYHWLRKFFTGRYTGR